ncbi:putative bifunctional diguanylate cyclase/phosphodiesterase [Glaciecola sp. 1036]|uniref:putative bifunctional diguanylate cyclase/phosphodiesterase n=1 Tax=Alteromonadaceae TaxID=72275 RepID=UPI003CFD99A4
MSGVFETQIRLFDKYSPHSAQLAVNGNSTATAEIKDNKLYVTCIAKNAGKYDVCGASYILVENIEQGIDLSNYYAVSVDMNVTKPAPEAKVKFSIRTFNPAYSESDRPDSNKYNSIVLTPSVDLKDTKVLLNYFQVESWWVRENNIAFEDSLLDFGNVIGIDFINNNVETDGIYHIEVNNVVFYRHLLSTSELLILVALMWLCIIVLLIKRNRILLHERATKDHLTNIANRNGLQEWIDKLKINDKNPVKMTMFYMDIDDFKKVNDTHGHAAGDVILKHFCRVTRKVLKDCNKTPNIFTRLSGDEFAIFAVNLTLIKAEKVAKKIFKGLEKSVSVSNNEIRISTSIGISLKVVSNDSFKKLIEEADLAMYLAKQNGKNQYKIYDEQVERQATSRKSLARLILQAIQDNQFDLLFMPIFDIGSRQVRAVEVMIQPISLELKEYKSEELIPIAEEYGLIQQLDYWVMRETFSILKSNKALIEKLGLTFRVNVSTLDLQTDEFNAVVLKLMEDYNIAPSFFALEVTETAFESNYANSVKMLKELSQKGIAIVLDNFGTGYTSLTQLAHYPISGIKIDKSFIQMFATNNPKGIALIRSIIQIAQVFDLSITAEGVDTLEQFYFLEKEGCHHIQGSLYSQPLSLEDLIRGLRNQRAFSDPSSQDQKADNN